MGGCRFVKSPGAGSEQVGNLVWEAICLRSGLSVPMCVLQRTRWFGSNPAAFATSNRAVAVSRLLLKAGRHIQYLSLQARCASRPLCARRSVVRSNKCAGELRPTHAESCRQPSPMGAVAADSGGGTKGRGAHRTHAFDPKDTSPEVAAAIHAGFTAVGAGFLLRCREIELQEHPI